MRASVLVPTERDGVVLLDDEVGSVRRDDSVELREADHLALDLARLARQAHLLDEVADLACGPEASDVVVLAVRLAVAEVERVLEDALLAEELATHDDRLVPAALEATEDRELLPLEEIGKGLRVDVGEAARGKLDADVGEDGRVDLVVEARQAQLDVLLVADVLRRALLGLDELIE